MRERLHTTAVLFAIQLVINGKLLVTSSDATRNTNFRWDPCSRKDLLCGTESFELK